MDGLLSYFLGLIASTLIILGMFVIPIIFAMIMEYKNTLKEKKK